MTIDKRFWNGTRWDGHTAFRTISHAHLSCFFPADGRPTCDIMAVECADGRWLVVDNWGGETNGADGVWDPYDPSDALPRFFSSYDDAFAHATAVIAQVCGVDVAEVARMNSGGD